MKSKSINKRRVFALLIGLLSSLLVLSISNLIVFKDQLSIIEIIGKNGLVVLLIGSLLIYVFNFHKDIVDERNKMLLYTLLNILVLVPALFLVNTELYLFMPFMITGMLISVMLYESLGIITNIFLTLIIAVIGNYGFDYIVFYIISGTLACILITKAKERQKMFYVAIYMMVINVLIMFLTSLMIGGSDFTISIKDMVFVLINAAFSVIITNGSLPLWETIFDIMTPYKLLELTNSNQKLLQRLMLEAPGTYHHSQMVANLAETAAADIGANALLARSGALFHDVGKLKCPEYFTENQNGINPHDDLAPESSAHIIISHVADGIKIASEYKLPKSIIEIIKQHQGDSLVKYFYYKAKEHSDGFDIDEKLYQYNGPKPQTNEAAIVMLADCVEAYVRALDESQRTMKVIDNVVQEIIKGKLEDKQLEACDLKIKELTVIAKAFKKVYNGMYHERVKYPKAEE